MSNLSPTVERFVLHWGEMGTRWGISRAVAQVHALLLVTAAPLTADEICESLSLARSTVSTSLKELQEWRLVRVSHVLGDRRDHFDAVGDAWDMAKLVADGRKRREIDPTIEVLHECVEGMSNSDEDYARARITELLDLLETASSFYDQLDRLPAGSIKLLLSKGGSLASFLGLAKGRGGANGKRGGTHGSNGA